MRVWIFLFSHCLPMPILSKVFFSLPRLNIRIRLVLTVMNNSMVMPKISPSPGRIPKLSLHCNNAQFSLNSPPKLELAFSPFFFLTDVILRHHTSPYFLWLKGKTFHLKALDTQIIRLFHPAFYPWTRPPVSIQLSRIYGLWAAQPNQSPGCSETSQAPGIPPTYLRFHTTKGERRAK